MASERTTTYSYEEVQVTRSVSHPHFYQGLDGEALERRRAADVMNGSLLLIFTCEMDATEAGAQGFSCASSGSVNTIWKL